MRPSPMAHTSTILILLCGLFEVNLCQPETTKEAELKKLGDLKAKLESDGISEEELIRIADELVHLDECKEAIPFFTKAINEDPLNPFYYLERGKCYEKINEMDEAINDYTSALQKKPSNEFILEKLILVLLKTKRNDEATKKIETLSYDEVKRLGENLLHSEEFEYAIPILTKAIEGNSDDASNYNSRGRCYLGMGNLDLALVDFDKALKLAPSNTSYRSNQLTVFFKTGRFDEAVEKLNILDEPELQAMGNAFLKDRKPKEALECFREAISKNPSSSYNHEKTGECHWMSGDFESAKLETEKAIDLLPVTTMSRKNLRIKWCEKLVNAGKLTEARLALNNFVKECNSHEVLPGPCLRILEIKNKLTEMEQKMGVSPSAE